MIRPLVLAAVVAAGGFLAVPQAASADPLCEGVSVSGLVTDSAGKCWPSGPTSCLSGTVPVGPETVAEIVCYPTPVAAPASTS